MKKCPVCGANVFEDMDTCYNCLHIFKNDENKAARADLSARVPDINIPLQNSIHGISVGNANNSGGNKMYTPKDFEGLNEEQANEKFFEDKNVSWSQVGDTPLSCGVVKIESDQALDYLNSYYSFLGSYLQSRDAKNLNIGK